MSKNTNIDAKIQANTGRGNTIKPAPSHIKKMNEKKSSRNWFLTLNNHSVEDIKFMCSHFKDERYVFQEEKGENGTPHLQGTIVFKSPKFFRQVKKINPKIHWEMVQSVKDSIKYCSDISKRVGGIWAKGYEVNMQVVAKERPLIREWQYRLLEILDDKKEDFRSINWWWEATGNVGKTYFIKWLMTYRKCCYIGGKANDAKFILKNYIESRGEPDIIAFNIPRRYLENLNYELIEQVKDMLMTSGKYESCSIMSWKNPHVLVFANEEPQLKALSLDRWKVVKIE